jgi:hypothetical protein
MLDATAGCSYTFVVTFMILMVMKGIGTVVFGTDRTDKKRRSE